MLSRTANATLAERVARGAERLSAALPGWEWKINWGALAMGSYRRCILGQLFASFSRGKRALSLTPRESIALGFDTDDVAEYLQLKVLWSRYAGP